MSNSIKQFKLAVHPRTLKNRFLHFALKGNSVHCVCCNAKYVTFLPAGIQKRANARCINCSSLERHRTLWMFLKQQGNIFNTPLRLLHVAPEKIFYDHFVSIPQLEYHPIDLMPDKYAYGNKTMVMDVTAMTYPDNFFDAVICNHVLEHIRQDMKAMQELYRVLKPGGWAILNTPVDMDAETTVEDIDLYDPKKQLELFGQPDHVRIYGRDFLTRLAAAGFKPDVIDYVSKFSHNEQFKYGLKKQEIIFYCTK
ncbi:MAG: methyltransferase protein [Segetibacter sp.]|nr:methyltransferase protein [Segetibacter sp.]